MAGTATPTQGASAQSQQPIPESPEIVAARTKANDAGYARNRAEAVFNAAKKEKGADSPEAQSAKKTLEAAQAEVEKTQAELRDVLKLSTKSSAPVKAKATEAKAPAKPAPEAPTPAPAEQPKAAIIEHIYVERPKAQLLEYMRVLPKDSKALQRKLERLLQEIKTDPKNLEYYRKQFLHNNGELLKVLEAPRGEMVLRREAVFEIEASAAKLQKR